MQPSSTLQPVGTQQHVETHPDTTEAEEQSLPSIDLPPDADFYGDYLQKLKEITWRFEISLETYLMERGINRERKPISSWKTRIKSPDSMRKNSSSEDTSLLPKMPYTPCMMQLACA